MSATLGRSQVSARRRLAARAFPPGRPLEPSTRTTMEARLGHDFSRVRVHHDPAAARDARVRAFAVGDDVVLGADADERSLAHELAHVAQQERPGANADAEARAEAAAERAVAGGTVSAHELGAAVPGLHAQDDDEAKPADEVPKPDPDATPEPAFSLDWDLFTSIAALSFQLPELAPPLSTFRPFQPGYQLTPPTSPAPFTYTPFQFTLPPSYTPPTFLTPAATAGGLPGPPVPASGGGATTPSSPPSRASLYDTGQFSFGVRLGLPSLPEPKPGDPPSAAQDAVKKAEFQYQMFTGKVPTGWEAIDKSKLAGAVWGIFSNNIAPGLAQKITAGLAGKTSGGLQYQFDATLLTTFDGLGLTFSIITP